MTKFQALIGNLTLKRKISKMIKTLMEIFIKKIMINTLLKIRTSKKKLKLMGS